MHLKDNPAIHITEEEHSVLNMFYETIRCVLRSSDDIHRPAIIQRLLEAMFYKILAIHQNKVPEVSFRRGRREEFFEGKSLADSARKWVAEADSPLIRPCGATFSLRAKSRLRRLRSDTRLRAQPLGGRLWENHSFGSRCAFSRAGRRAMYRTTAQTVESRELTSVTPLAILVTTETNSAGWPKMYRLRK